MNPLTVKSNLKVMVFLSVCSLVLMSLLAWGAMRKPAENPYLMLPFAVLFLWFGLLPFFSWKRGFERKMTVSAKGIDFQFKPGRNRFLKWEEVAAVGIGTHATVYLKDGSKLCVFWSALIPPENNGGFPVYRSTAPEVRPLREKPWFAPLMIAFVLLTLSETGATLTPGMRFLLAGSFGIIVLWKLVRISRDFLFRS